MAHVEPMDIDDIESDFDNKENAFQHNNVLSRTPCTEKGYEELDVSELNMKLRYSITPASSPMTKSLTGPCFDNRNCNSEDYPNTAIGIENGNLTRSLNSSLNKNDGLSKSKLLPLQTLSTDPFVDSNRNSSIRRLLNPADSNVIIISSPNNNDENLSVPSTCSSVPDTPEATTPTKEIPKPEGSPILRGLKSVLSMFRASQSPIPPAEEKSIKEENLSTEEFNKTGIQSVQVSTPLPSKQREGSLSKRTSPLKESLIFNDDLEKELQWKDDSSVFFKGERVPVHKLFFNNPITEIKPVTQPANSTVEYMDMSCNETVIGDITMTNTTINIQSDTNELPITAESDNEFLDCETTFTKNESYVLDNKQLEIGNETYVTGDRTVDVSQKGEIAREVEAGNKNTISKTIGVNSCDISVCSEEALVSDTDLTTNTAVGKDINIIEVTKNFLNIEYNYCSEVGASDIPAFKSHNVDLQNEYQVNNKLKIENKITDITGSINEQILEDNDVITTEPKLHTKKGMEHGTISCEILENKSNELINYAISIPEVSSNIDDVHDVCAEVLKNTDKFQENCSEYSDTIKTKQNIEILDDMLVTIKDLNLSSNLSTVDEQTKIIQCNIIASVPIMKESSVTNKTIVSTQFLRIESDKDEFDSKKVNTVYLDNELPLANESVNKAPISKNLNSIVNEIYEIIEDVPITKISKNEDGMPIGNETDTNLQSCKKLIFAETDLVDEINVTNIGSEEVKPSTMCNSQQSSLKENSLNTGSENDREIPEVTVGNDVAGVNQPSEIPLPIEDNIEQDMFLSNDGCNKQNTFEVYEGNSSDSIENKIIAICTEYDNATIISDAIEKITNVNNDKIEIIGKEPLVVQNLNLTQTCITQSAHVHTTEIIDTYSESKPISNLQMAHEINPPENDVSKNISMQEGINRDLIQNVLEIQSSENNLASNFEKPASELIIENVLSNSDAKSSIVVAHLENTEKSVNTGSEKFEETNQVKTVGQEDFTPKKELDEMDEEIITSANNSPYVSVTDLAIDVEKVVKEPLEEIDNPFVKIDNPFDTSNKITVSPPKSPNIVSKGYNFNFDEIDDPFATKIKIRMSPTPDTCIESSGTLTEVIKTPTEVPKKINNRRKLQPERKRTFQKKNTSLTHKLTKTETKIEQRLDSDVCSTKDIVLDNITSPSVKDNMLVSKYEKVDTTASQNAKMSQELDAANEFASINGSQISSSVKKEELQCKDGEMKCLEQTLVISTEKSTSSSEQYFSLGTSSGDSSGLMNRSKNVFNLPEIDDVILNPFATKSKMRMSPPPAEKTVSSFQCTIDVSNSSDSTKQRDINNTTSIKDADITLNKNITQDHSPNTSNTTSSTNNMNDTDKTIKEIPTEDEDTVEGPFLDLEEFKDNKKLVDIESDTGLINFDEARKIEKDENLENGELFIDADAFEFLLNQNKSTTVSDSGKESLFLKFDPLFAKRVSSDGVLAALSKVQKRQSTPKKVTKLVQRDLTSMEKPVAGPSNHNETGGLVEEYNEDLSSNVAKPMMVVSPAISSIITQKKSVTPKLNRRSLTFTSPAMAVIDRLLSLSGNTSHLENETSISQVGRERTETDLAITQLRELLAEKEINVHNLRSESKELKARLAALEVQVRGLETESTERLAKINELNDRLLEKTKMNKSMATVVEEYERTIASLIAETEQDKRRNAEERMKLIKERDEQTAHLISMEGSFNDLHSKYEKSKQIILKCKENEDICRKSIQEFQDNFSKMQNNYELLKQHATSKLNHANQELEKMNRAHEAEVLKMNALIKRKELHITSLEETLAQKTKANEELTAICDELINKVG